MIPTGEVCIHNAHRILFMNKAIILLALVCCSVLAVHAQSVYLDPSHEAYDYLKRMEAHHIITGYRDAVKPITRGDIAAFLLEVQKHRDRLNDVERAQLDFFREEFFLELKPLVDSSAQAEERWHLYRYRGDPGVFNVDLTGGYSYQGYPDGSLTRTRSNGLMAYGYVGSSAGTYIYFRDNHEEGSRLTAQKLFTQDRSHVVSRADYGYMEYDDYDAQVTADVSFLRLTIEKMPNVWGAGEHGNIILSSKPPSYPQIKLRAKLGKDIDFTYIHAWLSSDIVDSLRSYSTGVPSTLGERIVYRQKYIAAQMLEATPWNGVNIAIGESEVYGGRSPELLYLIPVMFFKAGEHYSSDSDNSQVFGSVDVTAIRNYDLYASLFIDEFSTEDFASTLRQRNQLAFTLGVRAFDLVAENTELDVEYTRCNPWVYNHKFPDATYQSHMIDLGHWIGQNADYLFVGGKYRPMRSLQLGVQFESLRKGGKEPTQYQYMLPTPTFLYSPLWKTQSFGVTARYEPIRDLFVDFHALLSRYTNEVHTAGDDYADKTDVLLGIRYNYH
jgi:hypothetical protein